MIWVFPRNGFGATFISRSEIGQASTVEVKCERDTVGDEKEIGKTMN